MELCKRGELKGGSVSLICDNFRLRSFVIFATKEHWRDPSRIEWIESGLSKLASAVSELQLSEIAVPALGCGLGGLPWEQVKALIEEYLGEIPASVRVYPPRRE
jgi:O-acetyl-ADP-ribose deacetylase (regulator of RNase III)